MKKRKRKSKDRIQLALELNSILRSFEDSFILKLSAYFKRAIAKLRDDINDSNLFLSSISKVNKTDVNNVKKLLKDFYKKVGKETLKRTNKEIQELSGQRTIIKIPDLNEGLRYRAEQLAIQKIKDFNQEIKNKVLDSDGLLKDKKLLVSSLKKAQNVYINRHVKTVARMESVAIANQKRLEAFKKSTIVAAVQFLSVADKRRTKICESRHNMIIRLDDPLLPNFKPPCHFGCRSLLSPVTIFEKFVFTDIKLLKNVPPRDFGKPKKDRDYLNI